MSSSYRSSGDRRHSSSSSSRRDSSHRSSSRRSPSPGPSRRREEVKERDPKNLPDSFGRGESSRTDDDLDILKRMKTSYINSPLENLYNCVKEQRKVKIWTRNYKEVRGVMTGYIIAFDKHWNLILKDIDEVFLKPKKSKTPFLREVAEKENLVDIPAKTPKAKKSSEEQAPPTEPKIKQEPDDKKKKKRRKKAKTTSAKRQLGQFVIRGDNIVMICPLDVTLAEEQEREEEEEEIEEGESRTEG